MDRVGIALKIPLKRICAMYVQRGSLFADCMPIGASDARRACPSREMKKRGRERETNVFEKGRSIISLKFVSSVGAMNFTSRRDSAGDRLADL